MPLTDPDEPELFGVLAAFGRSGKGSSVPLSLARSIAAAYFSEGLPDCGADLSADTIEANGASLKEALIESEIPSGTRTCRQNQ